MEIEGVKIQSTGVDLLKLQYQFVVSSEVQFHINIGRFHRISKQTNKTLHQSGDRSWILFFQDLVDFFDLFFVNSVCNFIRLILLSISRFFVFVLLTFVIFNLQIMFLNLSINGVRVGTNIGNLILKRFDDVVLRILDLSSKLIGKLDTSFVISGHLNSSIV